MENSTTGNLPHVEDTSPPSDTTQDTPRTPRRRAPPGPAHGCERSRPLPGRRSPWSGPPRSPAGRAAHRRRRAPRRATQGSVPSRPACPVAVRRPSPATRHRAAAEFWSEFSRAFQWVVLLRHGSQMSGPWTFGPLAATAVRGQASFDEPLPPARLTAGMQSRAASGLRRAAPSSARTSDGALRSRVRTNAER